jgi:hypothetical protein
MAFDGDGVHIGDDTEGMGLNPYRKFRARPADYAMVVGAFVVVLALLAWTLFG